MLVTAVTCPSPAYLAGFFDGEGSVWLAKSCCAPERFACEETRYGVNIALTNTYRPILDAVASHYGGSICSNSNHRQANARVAFIWRAWGLRAAHFLGDIVPFLVQKQGLANAALFYFDTLTWPKNWRAITPETRHIRRLAFGYFRDHPNLRGVAKCA